MERRGGQGGDMNMQAILCADDPAILVSRGGIGDGEERGIGEDRGGKGNEEDN